MTTHDDPYAPGTPCWADLAVPDLQAGVDFYRDLMGWELVDTGADLGHYHIAQVQGRAVAGIGPIMMEGQSSAWTLYMASDDADTSAKNATERGGTVIAGPMDVPGSGRLAVIADPAGGVFAVWQAMGMVGAGRTGEPGAMVWADGRQPDPAAARGFYGDLFGWSYAAVEGVPEGFDYRTFALSDGVPLGGLGPMLGAPENTPPHWLIYLGVADLDAALERLAAGGGTALGAPDDTPFGRMVGVTDPFGAPFALHEAPAQSA